MSLVMKIFWQECFWSYINLWKSTHRPTWIASRLSPTSVLSLRMTSHCRGTCKSDFLWLLALGFLTRQIVIAKPRNASLTLPGELTSNPAAVPCSDKFVLAIHVSSPPPLQYPFDQFVLTEVRGPDERSTWWISAWAWLFSIVMSKLFEFLLWTVQVELFYERDIYTTVCMPREGADCSFWPLPSSF